MTELIAKRRVARGIAFLDENVPGWRKLVKPDYLQMENCFHCILAQIFGDFSRGVDRLEMTPRESRNCGFEVYDGNFPDYLMLQAAWDEALEAKP